MSVGRGTIPRQTMAGRRAARRRAGQGRDQHEREGHGMKFTVERDALAEAVDLGGQGAADQAGGAGARGPAAPRRAGRSKSAWIERTGAGSPRPASTTRCRPGCRVRAEVAEPGTFLVPGRLLVEIVRSLPAHPVEFGDDPDGISVTCGEASFAVRRLPSAEYPELPELPQLAGTADGGALAAAIGQVTPAASRDDTLPMLTAVNVELDGKTMTLAATDRYRLAVRDLAGTRRPARRPGQDRAAGAGQDAERRGQDDEPRHRGPDHAQARRRRGGRRVAGRGRRRAAEAMIGFEAGERRLTARLLAGEFVRYRSRFPEEFGCTADLPADAFAEAVRRVALVAERGTPVQLTFAPGRVTVGARRRARRGRRSRCPPTSPATSRRSRSARSTCSTGSSPRPRRRRRRRRRPARRWAAGRQAERGTSGGVRSVHERRPSPR